MGNDIQEIHEKLDELTKLVEENQRMTRSLYQRARMATVVVAIKWILIIVITLGSLYYIQPYLEGALKAYTDAAGFIDNFKGGPKNPAKPGAYDASNTNDSSSKGSILDLIKSL